MTGPRAAHQREGHERFTLDRILAEEQAVLDLVDVRDDRALLWVKDEDTAPLSADQKRAVENIARSPWLIQPLSAPAGAGKTTSMRALVRAAHRRFGASVLLLAPTGKAVDVAVREGAGDEGLTIAKALQLLRDNKLALSPHTLVVVDEAAMVGTDDLRQLLTATTERARRRSLSEINTSSPRSKPAAACSPNCASICRGPNTFPRCGECATLTNGPRRSPCATAARHRFAGPSAGTAPRTVSVAGIRSRWPPTPWRPTKPTPPPARTHY